MIYYFQEIWSRKIENKIVSNTLDVPYVLIRKLFYWILDMVKTGFTILDMVKTGDKQ